MKADKPFFSATMIIQIATFCVLLSGCSTVLVSPYDEKLVADTEAFYKKSAAMLMKGRSLSPFDDEERRTIADASQHPAHFSNFESEYDALITDAEALILRSMASSGQIDSVGRSLQKSTSDLIETTIPTSCKELSTQFEDISLTAQNYVDLKCIVLGWRDQHSNGDATDDTLILKKANWEGRKIVVFNAILAIQRAEAFKAHATELEETDE